MEAVSVLGGAAPRAIDAALKLAGAFRAHQDAREAELRLLRVLYFEVCRNLGILERFHIEDRSGVASNDDAYRGVAKLLDIEAHLAVVLIRRETEDEREGVQRARAHADAHREQSLALAEEELRREARLSERLLAFRSVWGELCDESWVLEGDPEESSERSPSARTPSPPSKLTTMLRSLAFVSVKVPMLTALSSVDEATRAVMKDVRLAVRLEQVRQHESALKRQLEALPAVAAVRV